MGKIVALIIISIMMTCPLQGKVSEFQVKSDIKKQEPLTTSVTLENEKTEKVFENGKWINYYRRMYRSIEKTKWNDVTYHYYGGAQYKKAGGKYVFDNLTVGDGYYEGFQAPDKTELNEYLQENAQDFFGGYLLNKIVDKDFPEIKISSDTKWQWHNLKSVSATVSCTFTIPVNNTKLEKAEHTYSLRLYSDGKKALEKSARWTSMNVKELKNKKKVLQTTTHSAKDIRAMVSLADRLAENKAKKALSGLPEIDKLPEFKSSNELFYFIHNVMLTKNKEEIKAYLYHLVDDNCRNGNEVHQLTDFAKGFINKLVQNHEIYKKTHYKRPAVKHQQKGMIELYDKEKKRRVRFSATNNKGIWRLNNVDYYPAKADETERMAKLADIVPANSAAKMQKYSIKEAGFSIDMPQKPKITKPNSSQNVYMMTCNHDGSEYIVTAEPLSKSLVKGLKQAKTYQQTVINWGEQFRKKIRARKGKPYNWKVNGTEGIQTEWKKSRAKVRFFSVILGDMYYRIFVNNAKESAIEKQFFASFKSAKRN